jgi:serine phosphatase RsbU (regulator of sigma subunit)
MSGKKELIEKLTILNRIVESLNHAPDVKSVLDRALVDLVELMGLETAWIALKEVPDRAQPASGRFSLVAHHNLPPALDPDQADVWEGGCACQKLGTEGRLNEAYNEVHCSRLERGRGDRRGLAVHASVPLRSEGRMLGILNVAAPDWASFSPQALSLLSNVGTQMGTALERARLFDLLQERHLHERASLLHLSNQLLRRRDLDDLMNYLVEEARQMLSADACALLLPGQDSRALEFRATSGWRHDPAAERRQVPRDGRSGPGLVMHTGNALLEEDLEVQDPTSWKPGWLSEEGFRGHAVVPLLVEGGTVGVLVINQRRPRMLDQDDLHYLCLMANQAAVAIEKARLHEEELKMQGLEKELTLARQIQLSLLPEGPPTVPGWDFAIFYEAAREVGGDFYDFFDLPGEPGKNGHRLGIAIADVTGKGVPAAMFMARTSTLIRGAGLGGLSPSAAVTRANELILQDRRSELLLTAFYGVLDTDTGRLVYARAGHNPPLWLQAATGRFVELNARGFLLGALRGVDFEEREIEVAPGDLVVLYTDGVTEAMDANGQQFGEGRLRATLAAHAGAGPRQIVDAVVDAVRAFAGGIAQSDDLALLVIRRSPK